jgi:hypothetical protein
MVFRVAGEDKEGLLTPCCQQPAFRPLASQAAAMRLRIGTPRPYDAVGLDRHAGPAAGSR